jgi:kinesin family protein 6/9
MGKNGVKVIIRARPTAVFAQNQIKIDQDENTIEIDLSETTMDVGPSNKKDQWKFKFHQVLQNAGQDKVYEAIARDIVYGSIVDGVNGTIMAYGQTGAGKTFTMIGDTRNYQHRGIAPRAIAQLYREVENRIEIESTIHVSYMEIYNDRIYDLLVQDIDAHEGMQEYVIVEDAKGTYVRGLTQVEAASEKDALDQLFRGELQRTVAEHQLNKRSNRSHCIFTLHISQVGIKI